MMKLVTVILATIMILGFMGIVFYYYYCLTRKRVKVKRNDLFLLMLGSFVAGMLLLVLLRFYTGVHTDGIFNNSQAHEQNLHNQYVICHELNKQAE